MSEYSEYSLEEQLQVLKDNLPMLRDIHKALEKFNEREEKLEVTHDVNVDLTDVKGSVKVENSIEVNDLPDLIEAVKSVVKTLDGKDYSPNIDVKASDVKINMKNKWTRIFQSFIFFYFFYFTSKQNFYIFFIKLQKNLFIKSSFSLLYLNSLNFKITN